MGILAAVGAALLKGALPGLATVAGGYVVAVLHKILKKKGIELSKEKEAQLEKIVIDAILRTEEAARRDPMMSSEDKSAVTINAARADIAMATGHTPQPFEVEDLVDRTLPLIRAKLLGTAKSTEPTLGSH